MKTIKRTNMSVKFTSCLMNARSLCNKTLIVKDFVVDYKVDLLGITETWLHVEGSEVTIGELCPNGYRLLHSPRSAGRGGGVGSWGSAPWRILSVRHALASSQW